MSCRRIVIPALVTLCLATPVSAVADPIVGQIDTFQSGSQGWHFGGGPFGIPVTPLPIAIGGGPGGGGDNYLLVSSNGQAGPGGRLTGINVSQWAGNYLAAGVRAIEMDLNNLGTTDLFIRLLLAAPPFGPAGPENIAITGGVALPAQSGWISHTFSLLPGDLIVLAGTANATLAGAFELRMFHNPDPDFPGPPTGIPLIAATLGVDNIAALQAVPEPATMILLGGGLAALGWRTFRRRAA
jgi:hypothetical protein